MGINYSARALAITIMGTREFSELKQLKSTIDKNKELKNKIEDFKNKEKALYSGRLSANETQQRTDELRKIFEGLSSIPDIDRFLKAEKELNSILARVNKIIGDTLESNLKS